MGLQFIDIVVESERLLLNRKIRPDVQRWVNEAQRKICASYPFSWLEVEATSPAKVTAPNYFTLPPDFTVPLGVRIKDSTGAFRVLTVHAIEQIDANIPDQEDPGKPERAVFTGRTLLLVPGFEALGSTVVLRYLREPPVMFLDSDNPLVPPVFRETIIDMTVLIGQGFLWNDKGDRDLTKRAVQEGIGKMITADRGDTAMTRNIGLDPGRVQAIRQAGTVG